MSDDKEPNVQTLVVDEREAEVLSFAERYRLTVEQAQELIDGVKNSRETLLPDRTRESRRATSEHR